jgi:hypothetical protein
MDHELRLIVFPVRVRFDSNCHSVVPKLSESANFKPTFKKLAESNEAKIPGIMTLIRPLVTEINAAGAEWAQASNSILVPEAALQLA